MLVKLAGAIDWFVLAALLNRWGRNRMVVGLGESDEITACYANPAFIEKPESFFPEPPPARPATRKVREDVIDLSFASEYRPFNQDIRRNYLSHFKNLDCAVRLFLSSRLSRGTIVFVHGYLGGSHSIEQRIWPLRWFTDRGFNAALFALPFHGPRGAPFPPTCLRSDPRFTIEGLRQAIHDLRRLIGWLRSTQLGPVGIIGMSLGGYTSALLATVERRLAFAVPYLPLASIARFELDADSSPSLIAHLDRVYSVVSPLARPPLVPHRGRLVVGASADKITPIDHARMIARHFDAPLETIVGGHLVQLGRSRILERIEQVLEAVA